MERFKRNQVEDAICSALGVTDERAMELKLRLKRLLVTDRRLARTKRAKQIGAGRFAFYSQAAPGSGFEVMFTRYEAFAVLAGLILLEHGIPQATVVDILRQVRGDLETAHHDTLKKDPRALFDVKAIQAMAKPGMIATDNTDPIFLVFVKLSGSTVNQVHAAVTVRRGHDALNVFLQKHSTPSLGATFFEFTRLMHRLATNLSKTRPSKRGRRD
jgi:hypothetical protein